MTFAWPHLLWFALLPAALLVWELTRARLAAGATHPKILRAEAGHNTLKLSAFSSQLSARQGRMRPWLACGLILAVVALARPQWGRIDEPVFDQSREILIAMDLSRSMLTTDVRPSRLDRAKLLVQSLLEKLQGERVGLVVFSGTAFLQSPLSSDYEILREFLPSLNPGFLPEGGTNYRALIDTSIDAFASATAADRFLIVLSDGEATDDDWRGRIDELKKKNIRVIGLGVGTAAGAMIPDGSGGLVKDERGAVVLSKLESGTLRELAQATNGVYEDASNWIDLARLIDDTVAAGRKGKFTEKNSIRLVERFQWPLGLALWCLLVSFYYEFPVRPQPRELRLGTSGALPPRLAAKKAGAAAPPVLARTATVLLLLLLFPLGLRLSPAAFAAEPSPGAAGPGQQLGRIYSRLANQDKVYPQDCAEVARETLRWGQRLKESGQPVIPGPVHDAIQAVDRLIALDSKIADWTKLRSELEDLLEPPKEQKPPPQNQPDQDKSKDKKDSDKNQQPQDQQNKNSSPQDQPDRSRENQSDQATPDARKSGPGQRDKPKDESAFGNMQNRQRPPSPQQMQKVGGAREKKETDKAPADPSLAVPLQKLDRLRNQDSPAELFQLMDSDQKPDQQKPKKDW